MAQESSAEPEDEAVEVATEEEGASAEEPVELEPVPVSEEPAEDIAAEEEPAAKGESETTEATPESQEPEDKPEE